MIFTINHLNSAACVDEMLTAGPNVLSPSSDDIPVGNVPDVLTPTGATTTTDNPTPSVDLTLNPNEPPRVTTVKATVTNAKTVEVTLEQPNGEKITKVIIHLKRSAIECNPSPFKGINLYSIMAIVFFFSDASSVTRRHCGSEL